jgi:hypothetical protein
MYWWKQNKIDIQWSKLMCDQVPTPGRRHVADGWSMVRSQRWLIGYTFHHQKPYVVPTLGQPYQPNGWVAHVGPTWGERWHANCDVRPTMPTMYQRWINVVLLTGVYGSSYYWNFRTSSFKQVACLILFQWVCFSELNFRQQQP